MNTTGFLYAIFFSVIMFLSLYALGFFHNMKKYSLLSQTNSNIKLVRNLVIGLLTFLIIGFLFKNQNKYSKKNQIENSKPEISITEKRLRCLRMFGGVTPGMSAWEQAQAECVANNSESACECMVILSK